MPKREPDENFVLYVMGLALVVAVMFVLWSLVYPSTGVIP